MIVPININYPSKKLRLEKETALDEKDFGIYVKAVVGQRYSEHSDCSVRSLIYLQRQKHYQYLSKKTR